MRSPKTFSLQVKKDHYFNLKYDTKARWISYWYQIKEVISQNPREALEIGVGNKIVSDYLKKVGIIVKTCDFDERLKPDVVASVTKLPFKKGSFDTVLCAEVLEHLPFREFKKSLKEIHRVTRKKAIITLPHISLTNLYFGFKIIPFLPKREFAAKVDYPFKHKFEGEHYWEIGKRGYGLKKVTEAISRTGFKVEKTYYPPENPKHQFFILKKE
ncbi:MAG: class I SAM-dependent methyltransferase [Candidatus Curtissbacteria bacterium]|nr:class I SAM-dependent methyltransferase [Candidatus Curtissbacteria bacterium]